nr:hypothetical protein [uncultured Flavobacterium sp.]
MPEHTSLGTDVSVAAIRDYLFSGKVQKGDTIVLSSIDYEKIATEFKAGEQPIEIPLNILGVTISKDSANKIEPGKIHVIKNSDTIQ